MSINMMCSLPANDIRVFKPRQDLVQFELRTAVKCIKCITFKHVSLLQGNTFSKASCGFSGYLLCCLCAVGEVVRTLPEGDRVCGVTSLGEEIFILRWKGRTEIEVYDVISFLLVRCSPVPNSAGEFLDMTSCEHHRCVYACDTKYVHRLDVKGATSASTRWAVNARALSVNSAHNVLATCTQMRKIKEFTSRGYLLREVTLPDGVATPWHATMSASGQLIASHGHLYAPVHRVCVITPDGRQVVRSHGGQMGSDIGQYHVPRHLAIDSNESVFVLDILNRRVALLSPRLEHLREVVSPAQVKWWPYRMSLDVRRRRLYVTDNEFEDGNYTSGRVLVVSV